MQFSEELWQSASSIIVAILHHPFNRELAEGTLAKEKFQFYVKQDSLYLIDFARALALTGAKSSNTDDMTTFFQFAQGALSAERQLHQYYFELYNMTIDTPQAPSCFAYTHFLLTSAALRGQSEAMAALLPCFWIYREVGKHIQAASGLNNPFQKWIDTYSDAAFDETVQQAILITNRLAGHANISQRNVMKTSFLSACRLEWMFWESAYRLETWKP